MTGAKFVAAIPRAVVVGAIWGMALALGPATIAEAAPAKGNECLSGPKGAAPRGERWFYRVEHPSNRHCWYTRADGGRVAAQKPVSPPRAKLAVAAETAEQPAPEPAPKPLMPNVANARAEASASIAAPAVPEAPREAPIRVAQSATPTLADRWPDPAEQPPVPTVRLMKVVPTQDIEKSVASTPTAEAESIDGSSFLERLVDIGSIVLALAGLATLVTALVVRRRKQDVHDETDSGPMAEDAGEIVRTWYEPPMDRLRMARHIADLPRHAT